MESQILSHNISNYFIYLYDYSIIYLLLYTLLHII